MIRGIFVSIFLCALAFGESPNIPARPNFDLKSLSKDQASEVQSWITKMGDDSWPTREEATAKVFEISQVQREYAPFLKSELLKQTDAEIHQRLKMVIGRLQQELTWKEVEAIIYWAVRDSKIHLATEKAHKKWLKTLGEKDLSLEEKAKLAGFEVQRGEESSTTVLWLVDESGQFRLELKADGKYTLYPTDARRLVFTAIRLNEMFAKDARLPIQGSDPALVPPLRFLPVLSLSADGAVSSYGLVMMIPGEFTDYYNHSPHSIETVRHYLNTALPSYREDMDRH